MSEGGAERNRLAEETSPYLLQHASNPVSWFGWGSDAFAEAVRRDVPILLSVGYSACHWCHVMAHESFEDEAIAALMNRLFVNVKVDREERPDVDALYMEAVQAMTGRGGWPLTVFLTPEGKPFYGATYLPPVARHGIPSFPDVMRAISEAWSSRRDEVQESAAQLVQALQETASPILDDDESAAEIVERAAQRMLDQVDDANGGFGGAPKFPNVPALRFMLDHGVARGDEALVAAVVHALTAMARGGLRDHVGGGFHRYCVDAEWRIPHFEKMLYDNALLSGIYLDAWCVTGLELLRDVAEETMAWTLTDMRGEHGAFWASIDADTAEGEGHFYSWTLAEIQEILGDHLARVASVVWDVMPGGNFENGRNVLHRHRSDLEAADELGITTTQLAGDIERCRVALITARAEREAPATDQKVISAWNAFMIESLARGGAVLARPDFVAAAANAARFVLGTVVLADGDPAHSWKDDRAGAPAFLEDFAALVNACLALYEANWDLAWLDEARSLTDEMIALFGAPDGGFYRTSSRHQELFVRQKELVDGAEPSGNASAARAVLHVASLTGASEMRDRAYQGLGLISPLAKRSPLAVGAGLSVIARAAHGPREVAILGPEKGATPLISLTRQRYLPGVATAAALDVEDATEPPLLVGRRTVAGKAAAYVCHDFACEAPVTELTELAAQLKRWFPSL